MYMYMYILLCVWITFTMETRWWVGGCPDEEAKYICTYLHTYTLCWKCVSGRAVGGTDSVPIGSLCMYVFFFLHVVRGGGEGISDVMGR